MYTDRPFDRSRKKEDYVEQKIQQVTWEGSMKEKEEQFECWK